MDFSWEGGDSLRMVFVRPAVRQHPRTKEPVWFNHAFFFNPLSLSKSIREVLMDQNNDGLLPFRTYYGDGTEIEEEVIAEIREVYEHTRITFAWKEGDILLLDNMLTAHGRNPYQGERKILVGMSEPQGI
jgi:alpha-ketoglutarate-dependent taurine dioxygenase